MAIRTLSLKEYAAALLGPGPDADDPVGSVEPFKVQWLTKRLRGEARPQLPGYKAGRRWRATEGDVEKAIELLRPARIGFVAPSLSSLSPTSRRRLRA
ncbi:MAG: hypothetical protein AB1925_15635 [Actinomycetota bacterium]